MLVCRGARRRAPSVLVWHPRAEYSAQTALVRAEPMAISSSADNGWLALATSVT
jgi:hypothetical protein